MRSSIKPTQPNYVVVSTLNARTADALAKAVIASRQRRRLSPVAVDEVADRVRREAMEPSRRFDQHRMSERRKFRAAGQNKFDGSRERGRTSGLR
jgi:hypothetical protein